VALGEGKYDAPEGISHQVFCCQPPPVVPPCPSVFSKGTLLVQKKQRSEQGVYVAQGGFLGKSGRGDVTMAHIANRGKKFSLFKTKRERGEKESES
jgi:hypothetical protein